MGQSESHKFMEAMWTATRTLMEIHGANISDAIAALQFLTCRCIASIPHRSGTKTIEQVDREFLEGTLELNIQQIQNFRKGPRHDPSTN